MTKLAAAGRVIVLNGTSSSGKSTLARLLQQGFEEPHLHVQLDAFRAMEPPGYFDGLSPEVSALRLAALCRAINAATAEYARHGQHVILDHVLPRQGWAYLAQGLAGLPVYLVGVRCDLPQLQQREARRKDRPVGLAESQMSMHDAVLYDFEIDTSKSSPQDCAQAVLAWFAAKPIAHAFAGMVSAGSRKQASS
ncbi:chloramphenicol phosphotransferase CPT family protein [Caenimonas sp. SL110]|uniref:chloramphenicol phosphotransferase CPT family protein n=1 Tax=Caenimonas sp. SL110 TaxID=1450524 RepID=UPI000652A34F|nr:AAA family ATPase [Caenimonas sp. SL110]